MSTESGDSFPQTNAAGLEAKSADAAFDAYLQSASLVLPESAPTSSVKSTATNRAPFESSNSIAAEATNKKSTRWYRFTLRELLMLMTMAACICALVERRIENRQAPSTVFKEFKSTGLVASTGKRLGIEARLGSGGSGSGAGPIRAREAATYYVDLPKSKAGEFGYEMREVVQGILKKGQCRIEGTGTIGNVSGKELTEFYIEYQQNNIAGEIWVSLEPKDDDHCLFHLRVIEIAR
jgi:hypothetical protein